MSKSIEYERIFAPSVKIQSVSSRHTFASESLPQACTPLTFMVSFWEGCSQLIAGTYAKLAPKGPDQCTKLGRRTQ